MSIWFPINKSWFLINKRLFKIQWSLFYYLQSDIPRYLDIIAANLILQVDTVSMY